MDVAKSETDISRGRLKKAQRRAGSMKGGCVRGQILSRTKSKKMVDERI